MDAVELAPEPADLERNDLQPDVDYANRANWLRATVVGANDGLVTVASFMIGFGDVNQTAKAMVVVSGFVCLIAGACNAAIVEYVSFWTQHDIQMALINREGEENFPNPTQAAGASALSFLLAGLLPLLSGGFVNTGKIRVLVVCVVTILGFGVIVGFLGASSVHYKSAVMLFVGGVIKLGVAFYTEGILY
ncbi:hypothetical protein ZOSMA_24G00360 [Zostera marina]|uniref:Vacuolar iron transporter n=1 Tax=Zostera marina TaxID=29655 RepID=A0A0K9PIE5_ZOSMR|nr:hypothetical protein ZOSMA_24G00360 [Zostera marina]